MTASPVVSKAIIDVFVECHSAIRRGELIRRQSRRDKEFHFQDWFGGRLQELGIQFDMAGRNAYPDFRLVHAPLGFELKGLQFPGRVATYDSNSQIPCGYHNGRDIIYVFGRYPSEPLHEDELSVQFAKQRTIDKRRSEPALRPSASLRVLPSSTRTWTRGFDGKLRDSCCQALGSTVIASHRFDLARQEGTPGQIEKTIDQANSTFQLGAL